MPQASFRRLSFSSLCPGSVQLVVDGGSEHCELVGECEKVLGKGSAVQLSTWNGAWRPRGAYTFNPKP